MRTALASLMVVLGSLGAAATGCGSERDRYEDGPGNGLGGSTDPNAPFADGGGGGTGTPLSCKGLTTGTKSSAGCDYYAVVPDVILDGAGACFAAFITNTWTEPVTITVDYAGQTLDATKFSYIPTGTGQATSYAPLPGGQLPAGQVAVVFLNRHPGLLPSFGLNTDCPKGITPAITNIDAAMHGTGMGKAFHITTSAAVAAYDMFPYGGGQSAMTSATLLLPVTSWDTNYVAVDAFGAGPFAQPFIQIVAQQDNTEVIISPSADITGGAGVAPTKKGTPQTYVVNKGQVLQLTQDAALAGSIVQSNVPIGLWGGKSSLGIESCCSDTGHQQIPPVRALGSEYVGVRYRNRYDGKEETPPWRIIGAAKGTVLTWEPSVPAGAPTALELGQVTQWSGAGPFVVKSQDAQHPFYMSAHMTGAGAFDPDEKDGRGDPEFVNVIPPGEYLPSYVFFTDPTYSETNLVLVRTKGKDGAFADVSLDCAGVLGGWQPIGTSYEYTRTDLVRHNFAPQGNCNNGRHEIHSNNPFGLTVWGWGSAETGKVGIGFNTQYVSYAYPGGANVQPINSVVIPAVVR
jgi:IgGFc binding protein